MKDPLVFDCWHDKMKDEEIENYVRAYIVSIKKPSKNHAILVLLNVKTKLLHIVDSMKEEISIMTKEDFVFKYHVIQVEAVESEEFVGTDKVTFFYKNPMSHLIDTPENVLGEQLENVQNNVVCPN